MGFRQLIRVVGTLSAVIIVGLLSWQTLTGNPVPRIAVTIPTFGVILLALTHIVGANRRSVR